MLNSFEIRNFRLFRHLEVGRLGRVNLFAGRNNSGKSTFLEAVELYASNASPTILLDLVQSRHETWFSEAQPHPKNFLAHPVRHLFFDHKLPRIGEEGITLGEVLSSTKLHIGVAAYQTKYNDEEEAMKRIRLSDGEFDEDLSDVEVVLVVEEDEKTRRILRLDRDVRENRRISRVFYERQDSEFKYTWQVVSTENMSNRKVAALWDLTSLTNLESEVISALALIDDRVSGVAFVEDVSKGRGSDNLDADSPSLEGRWESIKGKLRHYSYKFPDIPDIDGTIVEGVADKPRLGFWLMPNNQDSGKLEYFCAELAEPESLAFAKKCVEEAQAKEATTFKAVDFSKAVIHTYLAWQNEPGRPLGQAITKQALRPHTDIAMRFTNWLRRLFL